MLSFFERRVPPYPEHEPAIPPKGFFAFIWACTRGSRGWIALLTITSIGLSAYEALLFGLLSYIVDWLPSIEPALFWSQQGPTLLGIAAVLLGSVLLLGLHTMVMHQALAMGNRLIMMHEGRVVLEVDEAAKRTITAEALLEEFSKIKGASLSDRTLLD